MRLILAFAAVLVLGGVAAIFGVQQAEISQLRAQLAESSAPHGPEPAPRRPSAAPQGLSADDRRFILNQYQDVLAGMNLPPGRASRFQDLLTKRIEVALNAQDAAARAGFAPDSAEMVRAEGTAIAGVDREIEAFLGPADDQHFIWLTSGAQPAPAPVVVSAPTSVVVNVMTPPAEAPAYAEVPEQPADSYSYAPAPAPYYYYSYPYMTVLTERRFARPFVGERPRQGGVTAFRPPAFTGGGTGERPSRRVR